MSVGAGSGSASYLHYSNDPCEQVVVEPWSRTVIDADAFVTAPFAAVVVACADRVIGLMFGPVWGVAAAILAVFAVRVIYAPVSMTTSWLFMSQGRSREMLHAGVVNAVLTVVAVAAGLPFGPLGVAVAVLVNASLFRVPLLFWLAGRRGPVSWQDLAGLVWPSLLPALGVIAGIRLLRTDPAIEQLGDVSMLALATAFSVVLSLLWFAGLPRTRSGLRAIAGDHVLAKAMGVPRVHHHALVLIADEHALALRGDDRHRRREALAVDGEAAQ